MCVKEPYVYFAEKKKLSLWTLCVHESFFLPFLPYFLPSFYLSANAVH